MERFILLIAHYIIINIQMTNPFLLHHQSARHKPRELRAILFSDL